MQDRAKEIEFVPLEQLNHYDKNRNKHPKEQIDRLCKLIEYQGNRVPLIVDRATKQVIAGNGRLMALKKLGVKHAPVIFQDFDSDDQMYAFSVSDNAVSLWAELELSQINQDLPELGPDFDLENLGIKGFELDPHFEPGTEEEQGKLDEKQPKIVQCPNCGDQFDANQNEVKD